MVCQGASPAKQRQIDREPARPPTDPERKIQAEMDLLRSILDDETRALDPLRRRIIERRIRRLNKELREWIPTSHKPDPNLKGGK